MALTGYLGLIRGGLPAASVKYLAEALGAEDADQRVAGVNRVVHSALYLYLVLAVACAVLGAGIYAWWINFGGEVPLSWRHEARLAFAIAVVNVAFGFVAHLPFAVMEAHDDFVPRNLVALGSLALQGVGTFGLLSANASVVSLALALTACSTFELTVGTALVVRRYAGTRVGVDLRDRELIGKLFHYSAWVLVLAVGGRLAFNTDALIISTFDSYDSVAYYNVANSIALYFMEFIAAIAIVVMPRAARLRASGDVDGLRETFMFWSKASMTLGLLVGTFLLFMGPEFVAFWIDDTYAAQGGPALQWLIASFLVFLPMRGAAVPVLMAVGDIKLAAYAYIVMGVLNVALSVPLVLSVGLVGAAIGTAIPNILFSVAVFQLACTETKTERWRYLRYAVVAPLLGTLPVVGWLSFCNWVLHSRGFVGLLYSGAVTVVLFVVVQARFVYRDDPHVDGSAWGGRVGRLLGRR
ncbi:MAG: oligosaccharide flippase family protein, partial [Myxococcales bacterium]|nr:oligosaccharide flippase family protein [Myxococcales bacterium]